MEKAWASSLAKASLIAAIKARMGFSSLACIVESAPRLSGEIANTTSVIAKRSWRECVMAVWDSTVDCDQNLVRSPPNETELSAGPPRPVNYGEHGKHRELFHKSNVDFTTASGWLQRLVRSGRHSLVPSLWYQKPHSTIPAPITAISGGARRIAG